MFVSVDSARYISSSLCVIAGSKHKTMLEARSGAGPIKAYPRPGSKLKTQVSAVLKGSGLQNKTFHCEICDVHVNSEIQLKQVGVTFSLFHPLPKSRQQSSLLLFFWCVMSQCFRRTRLVNLSACLCQNYSLCPLLI